MEEKEMDESTSDQTIVRAFELPLNHAPREVWPLLRQCWQEATILANWGVQTLVKNDVVRMPDMARLPKRPPINGKALKGLYGLASETFSFKDPKSPWFGTCATASSILRVVEKKYDRERLRTIWQRIQQVQFYRYPHPWVVHAQQWKWARLDSSGKPTVEIVLPGGVGACVLTLRGGAEFGRQMGLFRQVASGDLPRLEMQIRQKPSLGNCGRSTVDGNRIMVKMVARIPILAPTGSRTLTLITDPNAFWVAELDGHKAWVMNNDHMRRAMQWIAAHETRRQRLAQDGKAERRMGNRARAWQNSLDRACRKQHARMDSWLHETTAHLVEFCRRQKVGLVMYRDECRSFIEKFPWYLLKARLKDKLQAVGVSCICSSDEESQDAIDSHNPSMEIEECLREMHDLEKAGRRLNNSRRRSESHSKVSTLPGE
jgi:hypothetical protein